MAKRIAQFRYYNEKNNNNYPKDLSKSSLVNGVVFNKYTPIIQLGIQALPGTCFYLNSSLDPITIGSTGIYELDINGFSEINLLRFDGKSINTINTNQNAMLMIDIVYEDRGGAQ